MTTSTRARSYGGVSAPQRIADRRSRLVAAAVELYGTQGYAATGVKDVCRAAGVTDRYFYESFRNQSELFSAAFEQCVTQLLGAVASAVAAVPAEPAVQARAAIETFVRTLTADRRVTRLLFVEPASVGGEVEREVRGSIRRFADLVAATATPHLPDMPEQLLTMGALSLVGAIQNVLIEWLDGGLEASVDEMIDYFVSLLLVAADAGS
ncbi:MAG: TetR/AcrR family transcriptional regulator [Acidimicrobiia bacterium]|nr:TetR/AcrR family transcriptional regulator [Acidimicrobiia bacterium]